MDFRKRKEDVSRPFTKFTRPQIVGAFSVDQNREYKSGMENLKYLKIPKQINFNLNLGDETYFEKPASTGDENLNHITAFIMRNKESVINDGKLQAKFVCFRGLLRLIMCTPYENRDTWLINAIKYRETIYLCAEDTIEKKNQKMNETFNDKKFARYGFKFEKFILKSPASGDATKSNDSCHEAEEFCIMFQSHLNNNLILYGAEIDGVDSNDIKDVTNLADLQKCSLIEVKVKRRESNDRQLQNFYRFKSRNWWCQSFLVGIREIITGLRDDNGIVDEITSVELTELVRISKARGYWHANVCMNFLNDFLEKISTDMLNLDDPYIMFQYSFKPNYDFINYRQINSQTFLNREYIEFIKNL